MRIIHTSDWHLGQHFYNKNRGREHAAFFDWLLAQVDSHQVDAVVVAGDVFDTGTPPSYARALLNSLVVAMQKLGCQLVILGGNHDSVATLNESAELMQCLGASVIGGSDTPIDAQLLELRERSGQIGALLCAVPFLRPRDIQRSQAGQSEVEKRHDLRQGICDHYQSLYQKACERRQALGQSLPIIGTGHLTTLGASTSDSVRDIYVGNLDAFATNLFPDFDYLALGHIHRPQKVNSTGTARYCGSPIPLSFDELGSDKQVLLVEFENGHLSNTTPLMVPCFQPMAVIRGDLVEIERQLEGYRGSSSVHWLCVEVQSDDYLNDLQSRIETLVNDLPVEVLLLKRQRQQRAQLEQEQRQTLSELTVSEVFDKRLQSEGIDAAEEPQRHQQLTTLFNQVVEQLHSNDEVNQ